MERLTSNKSVEEMGMWELAHNCCYAKDRKARYRDFEMDMDARDFARNLATTLTEDELPLNDDDFDEEILENLQYDPFATNIGLIALFYRNLWAMADLRERLKTYEDAEEQGLILRLPCKVGDTVYALFFTKDIPQYYECEVEQIIVYSDTVEMNVLIKIENIRSRLNVNCIGRTAFFTKEEAEQALKQMGE